MTQGKNDTAKRTNASVKDFLVYLVKKGILPKQAVALCRQRKEDALKKGYSLTVKEILLEQGYLTDESEYQKFWQEMEEDHRIHAKVQDKEGLAEHSYSLSENVLESMISHEDFKRDLHPDVPTDVLLTVFNRWKDNKEESKHKKRPYSNVNVMQKLTQRIQLTAEYVPWLWQKQSTVLHFLCLLSLGGLFWVATEKWDAIYPPTYQIQKLQFHLPASLGENKILEGAVEGISMEKLQTILQDKNNRKKK